MSHWKTEYLSRIKGLTSMNTVPFSMVLEHVPFLTTFLELH